MELTWFYFFVLCMTTKVVSSSDSDHSKLGTDTRESTKDDPRVEQIFEELQGICLKDNGELQVSEMKTVTNELIKNMEVYKSIVKMNKQLKDDIKWILQETNNEKESTRIFDMVKSDAKDTCTLPEDCASLKRSGKPSGAYNVYPAKNLHTILKVWCDMNTDGGGWTVIQKRIDGSENFERTWADYENGFGNRSGEYWLGNRWIHQLTSSHRYELRIDLVDLNGKHMYGKYKTFQLKSAAEKYRLVIGGFSGNARDNMEYHNGQMFSTNDQDNDSQSGSSYCAKTYGAWWHKSCCNSCLNRKFRDNLDWNGSSKVLTSEMKIRRY